MCIVSIASLFDPSLAPPGQHTVHVYCAANEPWAIWEGQKRSTKEYKELKVWSWTPILWPEAWLQGINGAHSAVPAICRGNMRKHEGPS